MRLIKVFGLAAITALLAMAFVGASSAMAVTELEEVVFCKEDVSPCPGNKRFPSGTKFDAELVAGTQFTILSNIGNLVCNESTIEGETTTLLVMAKNTNYTFNKNGGSCENTSNGEPCEIEAIHTPHLVTGELNAAHTGYNVLVTEEGGPNKRPEIRAQGCGTGLDCSYGESNILFEQVLLANDIDLKLLQTLTALGFFCGMGANSVTHAEYLVRCLEGTNRVGCWLTME
jgi:hypothetical protein